MAFGMQALLEFGWQQETIVERLQQENSKLTKKLGVKKKRQPTQRVGDSSRNPFMHFQSVPVAGKQRQAVFL